MSAMVTKAMHRSRPTAGELAAAVTSIVLTIVSVATGGLDRPTSDATLRSTARTRSLPTGCPLRSVDTAWGGASA